METATTDPHRGQRLKTGGHLWGPERVRLGMSLRQLAAASGVPAPMLSLYEAGRMIPRGDEFERVMSALRNAAA